MRSAYLNALSPQIVKAFRPHRDMLAAHESFLLSFYYWHDKPCERRQDQLVVGDSGGFQVATLGARLSAAQAIRWQIANADFGYILDDPPYRESSAIAKIRPDEHWDDSLRMTVLNVQEALPWYDKSGSFRWWGIIQGERREQQEEWYGEVASVYAFDSEGEGWAIRPFPNNDLKAIAKGVRFAADKGIGNIHLLQTTAPKSVAVLLALAQLAGLEFVSYDSASAGKEAAVRRYYSRPLGLPAFTLQKLVERSCYSETRVRDRMLSGNCECSGCLWYRMDAVPEGAEYSAYIALHNYSIMKANFAAMAEAAEQDPEGLIREAAGSAAGTVLRAFEATV